MNLDSSLDLYNKAFSVTDDGIWDWNLEADTIYFSPTWNTMLGYKDDEIKNDFYAWESLYIQMI